jgi:hypothetical protein
MHWGDSLSSLFVSASFSLQFDPRAMAAAMDVYILSMPLQKTPSSVFLPWMAHVPLNENHPCVMKMLSGDRCGPWPTSHSVPQLRRPDLHVCRCVKREDLDLLCPSPVCTKKGFERFGLAPFCICLQRTWMATGSSSHGIEAPSFRLMAPPSATCSTDCTHLWYLVGLCQTLFRPIIMRPILVDDGGASCEKAPIVHGEGIEAENIPQRVTGNVLHVILLLLTLRCPG